ncbi:phage tail tube protein [uncultured Enterovirga sp.]|uniref:phage tail tube protein n=1 Tax=uncultured Enterovirga sp. TaxID=2026352 RepID=UPI0035CAF7C2
MAQPKTAAWSKLLVQLGDGTTPTEVFSQPCALVARGLGLSAETADSTVPDCDDPNLPSWVERTIRSFSGEITGSGRLALAAHSMWRTWFLSGASKNVRIKFDVPLADGGGHYVGKFVLTRFNLAGNESDGKIGVEVTMVTDGALAWVPASA